MKNILTVFLFLQLLIIVSCNNADKPESEADAEVHPDTSANLTSDIMDPHQSMEMRDYTPLFQLLNIRKENFMKNAPKDVIDDYQKAIDEVYNTGVTRRALNRGDEAPDFTALTTDSTKISSEEIYKNLPVVIVWYRGGWCPYCNIQLTAYNEYKEAFEELGAKMYAISPEMPSFSDETTEKNALAFEVLSDPGNKAAKAFNIVYKLPVSAKKHYEGKMDLPKYNGDESWELPLSAVYVINKDRKIEYVFLDADYRNRAEPSDVLSVLADMKKRKP